MDHLTEQDAGLLEQAASMLEGLANDERNRGNCSSSEGAACSAHAIRRLAPAMLRAGQNAAAWQTLRDYAEGRIDHANAGSCPDSIEGPAVRDPECPVCQALEAVAGAAPAAVARWGCEDRSAWFALAMGAAASLEDAANCLRDNDAQKAAMGAATHVRESCNKLWWSVPVLEAPVVNPDDLVAVPRDLIGSACAAIDKKRDAPKTLAELRRYTTGDLSRALEAPAAPAADLALIIAALEHGQPQMAHYAEPCERHAKALAAARRLAAAPQAPAAPSADERAAYVEFLAGKFPQTYSKEDAEHWWGHGHVSALTWQAARAVAAAPAAPAVDASDTALLDAMERERIAVIPEFEGPWDAQIFGEDEATLACGSGVTPRKAIAEAIASLEARKAHDAAQAKEGGAA